MSTEEVLRALNLLSGKLGGPIDVTDRASRLVGIVYGSQGQQLLQRASTYDLEVQLRTAGVEYDARQTRPLTSSDVVSAVQSGSWSVLVSNLPASPYDVSDRAGRLLGIVYGSQGQQLLQRASTYDLLTTIRQAGSELSASNPIFDSIVYSGAVIDPRSIRALTSADIVTALINYPSGTLIDPRAIRALTYSDAMTAYGSQSQALLQRATSYELLTTIRQAGSELSASNPIFGSIVYSGAVIDPRAIRALTYSDIITAYGSQTQALLQRASTYDLLVTIRQAGSELSAANPIFTSPYQATRTNLTNKPEREDLTIYGGTFSPNGTGGTQVVAGVAGKQIKVFMAGMEILTPGLHYFYFGSSTTPPTLPANKVFLAGSAVGRNRQTFTNPMVSGSGDSLYLFSAVAETNMPADIAYAQE